MTPRTMSKLRENVTIFDGELEAPAEGDLKPYVIFTQLRTGGPHLYAGWVDAADDDMALQFAREHYGQDQECVNIWAIPRSALAGTEPEYPTSRRDGLPRTFQVFIRKRSGDPHASAGTVEAPHSEAALKAAREQHSGGRPPSSLWVVGRDEIAATRQGDVIWRLTDQTYRLARGYSNEVRAKWEKIRAEKDLQEYEQEDLKESF